jgi:hypothetical protein
MVNYTLYTVQFTVKGLHHGGNTQESVQYTTDIANPWGQVLPSFYK